MKWTTPKYSREDVNRAGKTLLSQDANDQARTQALAIVNDWRAAHAWPLQSIYVTLNGRAVKFDKNAILAQRRKRLTSILAKLRREPSMKLSQMADIGGCRAIVATIDDVNQLVESYKKARSKNPTSRHEEIRVRDYIVAPKADGYRGVHLIYKYKSESPRHRAFNGQKIEIQIRTKLQHAWATAVEIVDAFTDQGLKSGLKLNLGDPDWRRFFVLMSCVIARREKCPPVHGVPLYREKVRKELTALTKKLKVEEALSGLKAALDRLSVRETLDTVCYLLVLDVKNRRMRIMAFKDQPAADSEYSKLEAEYLDKPEFFVVLVSVQSIKKLRSAYPNYHLDATEFLKALGAEIGYRVPRG